MNFDNIMFALEIIGTIAFAISGVMVAKEGKMDIFGAIVLGCATAVGGGVIRDLILGKTPPDMFKDPIYVIVAVVTCVMDFIIEKIRIKKGKTDSGYKLNEINNTILNIADSVGLAAFVVVGCQAAIRVGFNDNYLLISFVGVVTGIGGGIFRDMLAGQMPLIMRRRIYAMAAIAGAVIYCFATAYFSEILSAVVSMAVVIIIRFLAIYFKWNLPSF
ncbi:Uncharacterized membrane protein YeiH [Acetitomaculum ruminis DSM 5522]|uniref:Uncharacterized membrane protein YeiH n=1 Tax=Acetitomaculum ruminis DSM 5522 TaxID=1120918 RepID=A0A1I0WMA4_9FIRM|nr:trimeric intracellular cation channel family protein [Acetitomaculum ruminis]SFA89882.1 Uncharacterized membrane protein YeiH [Acetitomaculum ruminis DSM 5522]